MPSPETSRRNLEKAKAAGHPPRPWRFYRESRLIRRLVWQWLQSQGQKCSGRALSRRLGVSHTWVQKLIRELDRSPATMAREERLYGPATFEELRRAQEETKRERDRGWLREPPRLTVKEFKVGDEIVSAAVPTKANEAANKAKPLYAPDQDESEWDSDAARENRWNEFIRTRPRPRQLRRWHPGMTR